MGSWVTLHLIDENKLINEVIPSLKTDNEAFRSNVVQYLKTFRTGGIGYLSEEKVKELISQTSSHILETANEFDSTFTRNLKLETIDDRNERVQRLIQDHRNYDFASFFEFMVFKTCADFFPHIPLGKRGLYRIHRSKVNSLVDSIVNVHMERDYLYSHDSMGIEFWISVEDTALLYHCIDELKKIEDDAAVEGIIDFLEIAYQNKLGLVVGRELRETQLERLPEYKIISRSKWTEYNPKGWVLFQR